MEQTVRESLLGTLEDLGEEFETFKSKLSEIQLQEGSGNIPWSTLQVADPRDLTEEMLRGCKDDDGVEVTRKVLRAINQQDLAERLTKTTGGGGSNPDQESETHQDPEMVGEELLKERRRALQDILAKLKMEQHKSMKLRLRDLQEINPESLKDWTPRALGDLPWHFLRKVMALNRTARNTNFWQGATGDQASSEENGRQGGGGNVLHHSNSDARDSLHPLDVLCAILLCSDSFLQQEILSKMSMCQFALPLLLPALDTPKCTLMLWAMRDIVRKWRPHSLADSRGFREESLVLMSVPTISFVRLGSCNFSKSKLLNEVLSPSQQHHDFFIHRDMESGNVPRKIADGLVEISWYFPGGRENSDLFPEPVAVTNLRGDIESHWLQFSFLTEVSSAVFIVTESISERQYALLSSLQGSATKYYFILSAQAEQCSETLGFLTKLAPVLKLNKLNVLEKSNGTNETEFVENLQRTIRSIMDSSTKRGNMEAVATAARELGVLVDEDCEECQSGSMWAREITVNMRDVTNCKAEMLKLQGDLWNTLTKVEKELCRMKEQGTVPPEDYKMQLKEKLSELHAQQNNCELNDGLIKFINGLEQLTAVEKHHFLKWLKFTLDHIAKDEHSRLQVQYNALAGDPQKLEELDKLISSGSLGVEHFLRELGQLYEAEHAMVKEGKMAESQKQFTRLPGIAADLMLEGFPMELIDGDVSNIPLQWVTDVLSQLHAKLGGRSRMVVLTVLGGQSTGKSTLLNTMFGLQFAVSSGQCMRGAFMSLIKVAENFQQELGCDFILVIDTEGLKAPELAKLEDSYQHDNELATLVTGLSDITIVNMTTENVTEMKDVLQIMVHAFLRIKEIGQNPQCLFVHQNVSDVSAHGQNMRDRKHLLEQLNEITKAAARMEKLHKEVTFSDIMDYDPKIQDWYLPSLWQGVPPMAPVNLEYSESVGELKKHLFQFIRIHSVEIAPKNIPQFTEWVKSLWNALKHENFCFSFRNPLATEAYNQLSAKFSELEWELKKKMHLWLSEQETFIQNQAPDELESEVFAQLSRETQQKLQHEEDKIFECLEKYIKDGASGTRMLEIKEDFIRSTRSTTTTFHHYSHQQLERAKNNRKRHCKYDNSEAEFRKIIEQEVDKLLEDCRSRERKLNNEELEQEFKAMWREVLSESMLFSSMKRPIFQEMQSLMEEDLEIRGRLMPQEAGSLLHYSMSSFTMKKEYLDLAWSETLKELFTKESWHKAEELATSLMRQCSAYIDEKANSKGDYDKIYCRDLLCMINERLQQEDVSKLHTSGCFEVDLKLHILGEAASVFQEIHDSFKKETDPRQSLKKLKLQYFSILKDLYLDKEVSHKRARDFCDQCLKPALVDYMKKRLGIAMADDMLRNGQSIDYASRGFFQFTTQKKLLEENDFYNYVRYIENYEDFVKSQIQRHLVDHYSENEGLEDLEREILSTVIERVRGALENSEDKSNTVLAFIDNFCQVLQKDLVISKDRLVGIRFINSINTGKFAAFIQTSLSDLEQQILAEFKNLEIEFKLSLLSVKPQDEIFKRVFGCGKQCPFCKVPCEAVGTDHKEHFASVHRPQGLGEYRCSETNILVYELCSSAVVSNCTFQCPETQWEVHLYKDYRTIFPDWRIQPDPCINASDYWKFVFKEFNQEFAEAYIAEPAELPGDWEKITKEQALESLEEAFKMK
ncbi:up-regulator of cell proliferation-like [Terrapene carolina triunguis]|uniref:Up-regulator of cell proliferation-like n=1 Tax=Terrapene triunguis TaxID=2587831 RepID=A0A674K6Q9_9SAUR|nr:up-regulator of cell proliferation-like [Terrapene carolina triunguis]